MFGLFSIRAGDQFARSDIDSSVADGGLREGYAASSFGWPAGPIGGDCGRVISIVVVAPVGAVRLRTWLTGKPALERSSRGAGAYRMFCML